MKRKLRSINIWYCCHVCVCCVIFCRLFRIWIWKWTKERYGIVANYTKPNPQFHFKLFSLFRHCRIDILNFLTIQPHPMLLCIMCLVQSTTKFMSSKFVFWKLASWKINAGNSDRRAIITSGERTTIYSLIGA